MTFHVELDFRFRAWIDMHNDLVSLIDNTFTPTTHPGVKHARSYSIVLQDEKMTLEEAEKKAYLIQPHLKGQLDYYPSIILRAKIMRTEKIFAEHIMSANPFDTRILFDKNNYALPLHLVYHSHSNGHSAPLQKT